MNNRQKADLEDAIAAAVRGMITDEFDAARTVELMAAAAAAVFAAAREASTWAKS